MRTKILTLVVFTITATLMAQTNQNKVLEEFKILYQELLYFKSDTNFKKYGFSRGGPYHKWLKKVERLKNDPKSKSLIKKGFVIGELETLGFEYVSSKGGETELTEFFNEIFQKGISQN